MCYKTKIAANLEADMKAKKAPRTDFLKYLRKHTKATLRLETPEMKKVVQAEYERRRAQVEESRKMAKNEVPHTPSSYNTEIEAIPLHFQAFAFELAARTGWSFTLLAGGPDPSDGGCINTAVVHFGEDMDGNSYGKSALYPKDHLTPFANFLQTVYTQEQCDARALDRTPKASLVSRPEINPLSANLNLASITEPAGILPPNLLVCKPIEGVDNTSEPVTDTNGADNGVESLSDLAGSIPEANTPFWETFDFSSFEGAEPDIPDPSSGLMAESGYGSLMEELEAPLGVFSNYEKVTFPINNTIHEPQGSGPLQDFLLRPLTSPTYHAMPGAANTSVVALVQEPTNTTSIFSAPSPVINANTAAGSQTDEDTNPAIANPGAIDKAMNPQEGHVNESVTTPQEIGASTKTTKPKAKPQCKRKAPSTEQNEQPTDPVEKVNEGVATPANTSTGANTTTSRAKPQCKRKQADDSHLIVNTKRK
ncbi:hypothetical protein CCMSSC00406_0008025 [Pleurotus cornucopiae]|uniref:Uncharacterized protein n=1 Tax=Pleurotus cornucopiae TaxID=5321 RepID=A0ACB7IVN1_PLECO|nr:hypothetical protein CCMSSC00406_0008025 [Pleurotus cornucopiae]